MKKKEIYIIAILALFALGLLGFMKFREHSVIKKNETTTATQPKENKSKQDMGLTKPTTKAKGKWVGIVHRRKVIQWFDSGIDGSYVVKGDYGKFGVEVKNGKWHAHEVDCPNHLCEKMGWDDGGSLYPISCIPNGIYVGTSEWIESYVNS
ncbi:MULTISPECIES: NusG domain II-containing protein [Terrabacteria group]|uniref:NusG domain II-containing protein n=1 Tax=Bacillati TaxID=1783272 RepID=UPI001C6E8185|nr:MULTISPECIES: NusG domain II-containing protein [Terrabacteria group]MBW9212098.1 NusG domain II-containing protein [Trueperella sp. zg.1013]